jgi:phosphatidylserine decarboxylase
MAKYARLEVTLILVIGVLLTATIGHYFAWWGVLPGLLTLALLAFYRDPPRKVPAGANLLLSPADGRIMSVERGYRGSEGSSPELRICIFLSVLDVHVNRSPCGGRVSGIEYSRGLFLNALKPEATLRNENSLMTIEPSPPLPGPVRVRQIAGLLAKRIVCAAKIGDSLAAGERFGMIKLGSQTEIRVPDDPRWDVRVQAGESVRGGATVLAEWKA